MGAGGSTAVSCSSLDLNNYQHRYRNKSDVLREQQLRIYKKYQNINTNAGNQRYLLRDKADMKKHSCSNFDLTQAHLVSNNRTKLDDSHIKSMNQLSATWFDTNRSYGAYNSGNANCGPAAPIKVQSKKTGSPSRQNRTNAGAAYRYHNQRNSKFNELRKFSDSLPSLNNMIVDHCPSNHPCIPNQENLLRRRQELCLQQTQIMSPNFVHHHHLSPRIQMRNSHNISNIVSYVDDAIHEKKMCPMKRAVSLSSLHNLHNENLPQCSNECHIDDAIQVDHYSPKNYPCQPKSPIKRLALNDHYYGDHNINLDPCCPVPVVEPTSEQRESPFNPLSKKFLKFKQTTKGNKAVNKKLKQRQKIMQQQQQQGLQVLPPLPRSQSLHELIHLRKTENGQRMRTTGTLRGPLGPNGAPDNKVNLVAELLENRRQQQTHNERPPSVISPTSSSDDGIHDVSIDHSTGDSRNRPTISQNVISKDDSMQTNKQQALAAADQAVSLVNKKRIFKKNQNNAQNHHKRLSHNEVTHSNQNDQTRGTDDLVKSNYKRARHETKGQKSSLRRSVSHSALQDNLNDASQDSVYEDESDDLNELAKFLHQFKQRRANKTSIEMVSSKVRELASSSKPKTDSNLQQSPNSTTSSSGFASSICNCNSISSSGSGKHHEPSAQLDRITQVQKKPERKKYPAPKRPDDVHAPGKLPILKEVRSSNAQLQSSPSLLSVVDEYNVTSPFGHRETGPCGDRQPAALHFPEDCIESKTTHALKSSDIKRHPLGNNIMASDDDGNQLERLRKYAQFRQMSQSELALNHLASSNSHADLQVINGFKRDQVANQLPISDNKPYKSKLINIIRRISDKSNVESGSGSRCSASNSGKKAASQNSVSSDASIKSINRDKDQHHIKPVGNCNSRLLPTEHSNLRPTHFRDEGLKNAAGLSESLCDLNFDCDYELVKNRGPPSNNAGARVNDAAASRIHRRQQQLPGGCSSTTKADQSVMPVRCAADLIGESDHRHHNDKKDCNQLARISKHPSMDPLRTSSGNWHLLPPAYLDKHTSDANHEDTSNYQKQQKTQVQSCNESKAANNKRAAKLDQPVAEKPEKSKWPASGWLMNVGNGKKNKQQQQQQQQQQHQQQDHLSGQKLVTIPAQESVGINRDSKKVSHSMTSVSQISDNKDHVPVKSHNNYDNINSGNLNNDQGIESSLARVNIEATQLLSDLDHSLKLVSSRRHNNNYHQSNKESHACAQKYPFSRQDALSCWKCDKTQTANLAYGIGCGFDLPHEDNMDDDLDEGDDDEDSDALDEENYARFNRAMINATFDVQVPSKNSMSEATVVSGSPCNSFTFKSGEDNHQLQKARPTNAGRQLLSGAARLIVNSGKSTKSTAANNPICRSTSELGTASPTGKEMLSKKRSAQFALGLSTGCRPVEVQTAKPVASAAAAPHQKSHPLFGRLRNSLLNQVGKADAPVQLLSTKPSKISSSQLSLETSHHNQDQRPTKSSQFLAILTANLRDHTFSSSNLNDHPALDDNFILRRKTPTAGLRVQS